MYHNIPQTNSYWWIGFINGTFVLLYLECDFFFLAYGSTKLVWRKVARDRYRYRCVYVDIHTTVLSSWTTGFGSRVLLRKSHVPMIPISCERDDKLQDLQVFFIMFAKLTQTCNICQHPFWIMTLAGPQRNVAQTSYDDR